MPKRKGIVYWNIPVPEPLDMAVENAIKRDMHISKSDLVRDAVRRLLEGMGLPTEIKIQETSK
jgi:Arc/MetJ-type ribon-helix-helix transcriptional regulator